MSSLPTILEVSTLGRFQIHSPQQLLSQGYWTRRKVCDLFKLLLSVDQHRLHREQIEEILWPSSTSEQASNSFGKTLYLLRRALEPDLPSGKGSTSAYVTLNQDTLLLLPEHLRIDADIFETSAKALQTRLRSHKDQKPDEQKQAAITLADFDAVLELYTGVYLPEDLYEDWTQRRRDRLLRTHAWLLEHAVELTLQQKRGQRACEYLQTLLEQSNTDEQAHRQLMHTYARMGRRSEALNQFQLLRTLLKEELNAEPLAQTRELFRLIQTGQVQTDLVESSDTVTSPQVVQMNTENPAPTTASKEEDKSGKSLVQKPSQTLQIHFKQEILQGLNASSTTHIASDRISTTELVGRTDEIHQLQQAYIQARRGEQQVCFISGEPGIGKTRLAHEFARWLEETQLARVLWGHCFEANGSLPYQPIVDAISSHIRICNPEHLRVLLGRQASDLAQIVPDLQSKLPGLSQPEPLGPEMGRHNLYKSVAHYFQMLASEQSVVIILDDMQKVDSATLQLLSYLTLQKSSPTESGGTVPLFLLLYSSDEVHDRHPLHELLTSLARFGHAQELHLARLNEDAVQQFLVNIAGHPVSNTFVREIYSYTEGNPFFISEVLRSLIQEGKLQREGEQWQTTLPIDQLALPQNIRLLIEQRLIHLTPDCLGTLTSAAILGRQFSSTLLCQVCNLTEEPILEHLDAAMQTQILMPLDQSITNGPVENAYERGFDTIFTHDKFREVLTLRLNPLRKKAIHRKVARTIETHYANYPTRLQPYFSKLAHHHLIAENIPEAIDYFLKAAQHAISVYAFVDAADLMEQALALLTGEEKQLSRVTILQQLADAYLYIGQPDKAIEAGKAACLLWHNLKNPVKEAEAALIIAFSFHWQGRETKALNYIHHALACLEAYPDELHLLAKAYAQWGMAATIMGDTTRAGECLQRADDLHTRLEKQDSFISVVLFWGWCWHAFLTGTPQQMLTYALHGNEICQTTHRPGWEPMLSCSAACALMLLGRIAEGEEMARDALEKAQRYNAVGAQGWANLFLSFLAVQQKRWELAEYYSNTALSIAQRLRDADLQARVFWSRSLAAGKQGYKELAISHAMEALHIMQREDETSMIYPHLLLQTATSYFYAEQIEHAQMYLNHAMSQAHNRQYRQLSALGQRLQGQILSIQGKRHEAQFCFEQSLAALAELHDSVEYARTEKAYTQLLGVH